MEQSLYEITGLSICGTNHQRAQIPCQDFHLVKETPDGVILVASDGAGSAKLAEKGAQFISAAVVDALIPLLQRSTPILRVDIQDILVLTQQLLQQQLAKDSSIGDYAATLMGAVITTKRAYFFQVGDGAWVIKQDGYKLITPNPHMEFVNETVFATSPNATKALFFHACDVPEEIYGFTDGIETLALDTNAWRVHTPFFELLARNYMRLPLSERPTALTALLTCKAVNDRTVDDKTLICFRKPC